MSEFLGARATVEGVPETTDRSGRTKAVVVGGTVGLGLATTRLLLEAGAEVVATGRDARSRETARCLAPFVRDGGSIVLTAVTGEPSPPGRRVSSGPQDALAAIAQVLGAGLAPRIRVEAARSSSLHTSAPREAWLPVRGRARSPGSGNEPLRTQRRDPAEEIARAVLELAFDAPFLPEFERTVDALLESFGVAPEPRDAAGSRRSFR